MRENAENAPFYELDLIAQKELGWQCLGPDEKTSNDGRWAKSYNTSGFKQHANARASLDPHDNSRAPSPSDYDDGDEEIRQRWQ